MPITDDLKDMMPDTAVWRQFGSRDDYGSPEFGTDVPFDHVRLVRKHKLVRNAEGDTEVSTAHLWIAGAPAIGPQDQIELSDGTTPHILSVERFQDEDGDSHTKVYFR